jgi:hypothetical protein
MTIHDDPRDIDNEWPVPPPRAMTRERLEQLITDPEIAQAGWNGYVAPLYDTLAARAIYSGSMRCRICGKPHARSPYMHGKAPREHAMWCRHYVGPLTHAKARTEKALIGYKILCTCGNSYPADGTAQCPDAHLDWRGPRP